MKKFTTFVLIAEAFNAGAANRDLGKDGEQYAMDKFRKLGIPVNEIVKQFHKSKKA